MNAEHSEADWSLNPNDLAARRTNGSHWAKRSDFVGRAARWVWSHYQGPTWCPAPLADRDTYSQATQALREAFMPRVSGLCVAVLWAWSLGCASAVQPGLANAPALGGARVVDPRVHDAIANGPDSCGGRLDPAASSLRNRFPPCAPLSSPTKSAAFVPQASRGDAFVPPADRYNAGWPCPRAFKKSAGEQLVAWSPTDLRAARCALP
jgi:hypothetical protein